MSILGLGILMLVMLNPVALFLYLSTLDGKLNNKAFFSIIRKATLIAGFIYMLFIISGDFIFLRIFQIDFDSFRLFGGIIIFSLAFRFIINGKASFIKMKDNLDDMAVQLALPFMVGAGSISVSILIGNAFSIVTGLLILFLVLAINILIILFLKRIQIILIEKHYKAYFDKLLGVAFRLNSFFMGAIGVDMVIVGIKGLFGL